MTKQQHVPASDQLRAHARQLAVAFKIRLIESDQLLPDEALAMPGRRLVLCSCIVDTTTYAVALHEMGHVASPTGLLRHVAATDADHAALKRDEEDAAWTWARHYALVWTPEMDAVATWAEGTYAARPSRPAAPAAAPTVDRTLPPPNTINWKNWSK